MKGIFALVVGGISLLLNIIALAIPYWLSLTADLSSHLGLWQICDYDSCTSIPVVDSLKATRAMEILGMLLLIVALVCAVLKMAVMKSNTLLPKITAGLAVAAGTFMFIGCMIFIAKFVKDYDFYNFHACFPLSIIAGVGSIVTGVLFVCYS